MDTLHQDILIHIFNYLNDYEKIKLGTLNKYFNNLYWYFLDKKVVIHDRNYVRFLQFYYEKLPKITHLKIKNLLNPHIEYSIYPYLETVTLNLGFKNYQEFINNLPCNIKHLKLGYTCNENLIRLPENLETLEIYNWYGQQIEFPKTIKKITFVNIHDKLPELPNTVKIIKIGFTYRPNFIILPSSISTLYTHSFNKKIIQMLNFQSVKVKYTRNIL